MKLIIVERDTLLQLDYYVYQISNLNSPINYENSLLRMSKEQNCEICIFFL